MFLTAYGTAHYANAQWQVVEADMVRKYPSSEDRMKAVSQLIFDKQKVDNEAQ